MEPAKPIILDEIGAVLIPKNNVGISLNDNYLGVHGLCHGTFSILRDSETHNVIVCSKCFKRIVIPNEVVSQVVEKETYEKLRQWCVGQILLQRQQTDHIRTMIARNTPF